MWAQSTLIWNVLKIFFRKVNSFAFSRFRSFEQRRRLGAGGLPAPFATLPLCGTSGATANLRTECVADRSGWHTTISLWFAFLMHGASTSETLACCQHQNNCWPTLWLAPRSWQHRKVTRVATGGNVICGGSRPRAKEAACLWAISALVDRHSAL